jgi:hypothetical protein
MVLAGDHNGNARALTGSPIEPKKHYSYSFMGWLGNSGRQSHTVAKNEPNALGRRE